MNKWPYTEHGRRRRQKKRAFLVSYKEGKPCMDCGRSFPHYCMDFDHRPGEQKKGWLNKAIAQNWSYQRIEDEIEKCDLVCANCHRRREWARKEARALEGTLFEGEVIW